MVAMISPIPKFILFFVLSVALFPRVVVAVKPRACTVSDPPLSEADKLLPSVQNGSAVFHKSEPIFIRNHRNYSTTLFGLSEARPDITQSPYTICLRYEFENTSGEQLQELRWPEMGVANIKNTPPGKRYTIRRDMDHNSRSVGVGTTELYIFRRAKARTTSVFPELTIHNKLSQQIGHDQAIHTISDKAFPDAAEYLLPETLVFDAGQSLYRPQEIYEYPPLQVSLKSDDTDISVTSYATAYPDDRYVSTYVRISVESKSKATPVVTAPGIMALNKLDFNDVNTIKDRIRFFSESFKKKNYQDIAANILEKANLSYSMVKTPEHPMTFIVEQPVNVVIADWSACIVVQVYAPIPVSLIPSAFCGNSQM